MAMDSKLSQAACSPDGASEFKRLSIQLILPDFLTISGKKFDAGVSSSLLTCLL